MPQTVKPPISPDVAEVIGDFAEKVENRSLLLGKFVLHKSWPSVIVGSEEIKWDDASRWSFIRMTQNGDAVLVREEASLKKLAESPRALESNKKKAQMKLEAIRRLRKCSCRTLPSQLASQKLIQNVEFARTLKSRPGRVVVLFGELQGRLVVNLSDSLIQNAGICLDRNTGIPYLPGSAVKGVSRHVALEKLRAGDWTIDEFMKVFGSSDADFKDKGELHAFAESVPDSHRNFRGLVDFLPANPVTEPKIEVDISTVHYPDYYQSGKEADLAKENLRPNSFPVVAAGVRYAFCIVALDHRVSPELFSKAKAAFVEAMTVRGFGAKTGAGYGWFKDVTEEVEQKLSDEERIARERAAAEDAKKAEEEQARIEEEKAEKKAAMTPLERILDEWSRAMNVKAIVNSAKVKDFSRQSVENKTAIAEALSQPDGIGHKVWMVLKGAIQDRPLLKLRNPIVENAVRAFYKNELKKGKMP